jgi:hypothetical protein
MLLSPAAVSACAYCLLCAGPLFAALHSADGDSIIQFMFPPERLPAHTQVRLQDNSSSSSMAVMPSSYVAVQHQ